MATLSAPNIWEPLYECASQIAIDGYLPGAAIDIYAVPSGTGEPLRVGGGVSNSSIGQIFWVASTQMVAGATVYATQTYDGTTSPHSPEVILQSALSVGPPNLIEPLMKCGRCVRVEGMLPGAIAQVRDGAVLLGEQPAYTDGTDVGVSPALVADRTITARQLYCSTPGPDSPGLIVSSIQQDNQPFLPPLEIQAPLYACQQYVNVEGCMPGSHVELFVDMVQVLGVCAADTTATFWVSSGLVQGTSITARQQLCNGEVENPMSNAAIVQPAEDIPRPAIYGPLYEGDARVVVAMCIAGEIMTIEADGDLIGRAGTGGGDTKLNVAPSLVAGQSVVATVELCEVEKKSLPVMVRRRPTSIPAPRVAIPLYACGTRVHVYDCLPGAKVRVQAGAIDLSREVDVREASVTATVTPPLQNGQMITATQEVGGVTSPPSNPVKVQPAPSPTKPKLCLPLYECARCVRVETSYPGARVNVYQDGNWIGGATAWTTEVAIDIYPPLLMGATITATQTLCDRVSPPAVAAVGDTLQELPTPTPFPPHPGDSAVMVWDLVPGAIVEIEEIDVYNQIIGESCITEVRERIQLNLPLFLGAKLRVRQRLCTASSYSPVVDVIQPSEWPLGEGPYKAGYRLVTDIPVHEELRGHRSNPNENRSVIYYPATAEGNGTPVAKDAPFPLIVYGHARRYPVENAPVCPGTPEDITKDFCQLSGILEHLARWGFVIISPDLSWHQPNSNMLHRTITLTDAVSYMLAENSRTGSPFNDKIETTGISVLGYSESGGAALYLKSDIEWFDNIIKNIPPLAALGLIAPAVHMNTAAHFTPMFSPKPILVIQGTEDIGTLGAGNAPLNVYAAASPKKYLITIDGANHFGYTDALCLSPPLDGTATISQDDQQRIAKAYLTALFRRYLQGDTEMDDYLTGVRPIEELKGFGISVDTQT